MDISQSLYPILAGVLLVLLLAAAVWFFLRRGERGDGSRREPVMEAASAREAPSVAKEGPAHAGPAPPALADGMAKDAAPTMEAPALAVSENTMRELEHGYRGYRIRLREKQPGLWVAAIADGASRGRKKPGDSRKNLVTPEYYQFPAALAEAKTMIDRRLAARH